MIEALTPKEAEAKQCPLIRFQPDPINNPNHEVQSCCIGDACMCWRWVSSLTVNNPSRVPGAGTQEITQKKGYCGIGGKP